MPPSKKRKVVSAPQEEARPSETQAPGSIPAEQPESIATTAPLEKASSPPSPPTAQPSIPQNTTTTTATATTSTLPDRLARFKALQARAQTSSHQNLKAAATESKRLTTDPTLLSSLTRKKDIATHNLLKADAEAAGEDFERKRAWDWTVDESEKWDKRMAKKERHREDVAFQDYTQDARKIYKRQLREMPAVDIEAYERQKADMVQKAARNGGLEIVEMEDGELVAVDRAGSFYATADSTGFVENRPEKAAVDRLVGDLKKAEETRLRKRRERGRAGEDEGDVTFINDKNKQFNQKLARFYNKYTAEIRDSFERGTMI